jgi:hypothetical protein
MAKHKHLEKRALLRLAVFGAVTIFFVLMTINGLTANSQGAKDRYDALIAVDQSGGDVEVALNDLRVYIYNHMNTQIGSELGVKPPIQLSGTYSRLVEAENARVAKANDGVYARAQAECEALHGAGALRDGRVPCVQEYIDKNSVKPAVIEDDFYKFDFAPPRWSSDLAGISMILAGIFGLIFAIDLILYFRTRSMINLGN